ncbi:MAG: DNA-3-methyladenine glycosylase 2 family protein [Myxococcota bacterium]
MGSRIQHSLVANAAELSPTLASTIERQGPIRLRRHLDGTPLVDVLCRAVAGQQLSVTAARSIWGRVIEDVGTRPLEAHLADAPHERLRACGLSGSKVKTMCAIAEASRSGALCNDTLRGLDRETRTERLTSIWGVGPWTADMMNIFYFGDRDVWPDGDVTARKTLARLTSRRRKTILTAERFSPYRSYLALHMWRAANAKPNP